jgi:hypothetical protein
MYMLQVKKADPMFYFFSWYMISIISHKHFIQFSIATYIYIVCQSILLIKKIMFRKKSSAFKGLEPLI